jgi:hypothetical protein
LSAGGGRAWTAAAGAVRARIRLPVAADLIALLLLLRIGALYLTRLDSWRINDDEGSYLYAAWRIALGELPYQDFLTPQLPAFLLPGGWLMRLTGPSDHAARAAMAVMALLAALTLWWTVRRLHGPVVAALAGALLLLQPDVFAACRTFRSEPVMLLFITLGTAAFLRGAFPRPSADTPPDRRWLALAGALFGLATLAKLFGPWPLAGLLLWLLDDARRRGRPWAQVLRDLGATLVPCTLVVAGGLGGFALLSDAVYEATIDHHLRQGGGLGPWQVLSGGLAMFGVALRDAGRSVPMVVAVAVALTAWRQSDRRVLAWGWQLPLAIGLLLMSRERYPRHLLFLTPAVATLFALGLHQLYSAGRGRLATGPGTREEEAGLLPRAVAIALAVGVLGTWFLFDRDYTWAREEDGTERAGDLAALLTQPEQIVLSDYSELNFYAQRPTTYSAASLSSGALRSGQITWARLAAELAARDAQPALVLLEADSPESHLAQLYGEDRAAFEAWLDAGYTHRGTLQRGPQRYEVHLPADDLRPASEGSPNDPPYQARFTDGPTLLAAEAWAEGARSDGRTRVISRSAWWRHGDAPIADELVLTLRLVDGAGRVWQQADGPLRASTDRATPLWAPDEMTSQRLVLDVPAGAPPGRYELRLGLYPRGQEGELSANDAAGNDRGPFVAIGAIDVPAWQPRSQRAARRALGMTPPPEALQAGEWRLIGVSPWPPTLDGAQSEALSDRGAGPDRGVGNGASPEAEPEAEREVDPGTRGAAEPVRQRSLTCGDMLEIETAWRKEPAVGATTGSDPQVELSLSDPSRGVVAASHAQPVSAAGAALEESWPTGTTILRRLRAPVRPGAAGRHTLALRIAPEGDRPPGVPIELGQVEVTPCTREDLRFEDPGLPRSLDVELGGVATLIGVDAPDNANVPGGAIDVTLAWRAVAPSETPLQVTVQLLDTDGRPVAASDAAPGGGARPTSGWIPGEVVIDRHRLELPDLLVGSGSERSGTHFRLVAALYQPSTGARIPITAGAIDEVAPGLVEIGTVRVVGPAPSIAPGGAEANPDPPAATNP